MLEVLIGNNFFLNFKLYSDLDQSHATEETPEGEEHPPADSENK